MERSKGCIAIVAAVIVVAAAGVALMVLMAVTMSSHWGMMGRGSSGEDQPLVVATAGEVTIDIRGFTFVPGNLTVNAGTKVTWVNHDSAPHTATSRSGAWDSGKLEKGESATLLFDTPGSYPYYCVYHPNMTATLTVR